MRPSDPVDGGDDGDAEGDGRGQAHDDLVLAVALACWGSRLGEVGERRKRLNY